jgi:hypothetical protein
MNAVQSLIQTTDQHTQLTILNMVKLGQHAKTTFYPWTYSKLVQGLCHPHTTLDVRQHIHM